MKLQNKRTLDHVIVRAIGYAAITCLLIMGILVIRSLGQSIVEEPKPKKHVVYNYDPTEDERERDRYERNDQRVMRLETQMEGIRDKLDAVNLVEQERRMTQLEEKVETLRQLLWGIALGLIPLLLETAHRKLRPKTLRTRKDDFTNGVQE